MKSVKLSRVMFMQDLPFGRERVMRKELSLNEAHRVDGAPIEMWYEPDTQSVRVLSGVVANGNRMERQVPLSNVAFMDADIDLNSASKSSK